MRVVGAHEPSSASGLPSRPSRGRARQSVTAQPTETRSPVNAVIADEAGDKFALGFPMQHFRFWNPPGAARTEHGSSRSGECGSPEPGTPQRASHVLKRSVIDSAWFVHHSGSFRSARVRFPAALGMCGRISTPVSACVPIKSMPDRRVGL